MSAKPVHDCPLCAGTGKVSKQVAESKIEVRDRVKWLRNMREINKKARQRRKHGKRVAT